MSSVYSKLQNLNRKATGKREETWCLSTVNFDRRDSDKPCENGAISFVGVGDSCINYNVH